MKTTKILATASIAAMTLASCHNSDYDFQDFDYQTVYFAKQTPARIVTLGTSNDIDLTPDNKHQIEIKAILGGLYDNESTRVINIEVDNSLCDGLYFTEDYGGRKVTPLPAEYYSLASDKILIGKGSHDGGVTVQLTDSFFNDPLSLDHNYVIPVVMKSVNNVDSILQGKAKEGVAAPNRVNPSDWATLPKDYVLYGVRFVNEYHGCYLRRGTDKLTTGGGTVELTRKQQYVERDEETYVNTSGYRKCTLSLGTGTDADHLYKYKLELAFAEDGTCTVGSADPALNVSGTGRFVVNGEKNSIGGKDRNGLYLEYTVEGADWKLETSDILVMRDRNVHMEYFEVELR